MAAVAAAKQSRKRIETLVREGRAHLDANTYKQDGVNGVSAMDIARALDRIREAEKVLRKAFDGA